MEQTTSGTFEYKDKKFGDSAGITVATDPEVFYPTSTTNLLLSAVRQEVGREVTSALDIGCGCGVVAVVLAKQIVPHAQVHASDISPKAVALAQRNAADHELDIICRSGSLFEPWEGMQFDLIVDDVAGMSEPIARHSQWYPPEIHSDAGEDGSRWITRILEQAPAHLTPAGKMFFPVLTLSDETKIIDCANEHFAEVELITEQWYPLGNDLLAHMDLLEDLRARGVIELKQRGSRWLWATKIYRASNRK